jgi:CDP-diacylglycerol--glycerol-3-phosphate 3-phosphatidyltransferase
VSPNAITILRILATPVGVYFITFNDTQHRLWAYLILFIVAVSDVYDGRLARATNQVTELGKLLDPIADKFLIGATSIALSLLNLMPWWITVLLLVRELGITVFRFVVIKDGVIPANRGGKLKTLMQNLGIGWYLLPLPDSLADAKLLWMIVTLVLTYVTGWRYLSDWKRLTKQ